MVNINIKKDEVRVKVSDEEKKIRGGNYGN